jgi:magnesium transporter
MIQAHTVVDGQAIVREIGADATGPPEPCPWIDLHFPTKAEEMQVEAWVGLDLPTRDEAREIETSSRLYTVDGATVMTATLVTLETDGRPETGPVTFVLTPERLITIRYSDPVAFRTWARALAREPAVLASPASLMAGLLDAIIDRLADILEGAQADLDGLSRTVFDDTKPLRGPALREILSRVGRTGDLVSKVSESLVSFDRVHGHARRLHRVRADTDAWERLKGPASDIPALREHAGFLNSKSEFLLNATLGKINIEQNATIKIFSVVAVIFMPPTLIASIYGMNFEHMPELTWLYGYPAVLLGMIAAAILPYLVFKRLGWL